MNPDNVQLTNTTAITTTADAAAAAPVASSSTIVSSKSTKKQQGSKKAGDRVKEERDENVQAGIALKLDANGKVDPGTSGAAVDVETAERLRLKQEKQKLKAKAKKEQLQAEKKNKKNWTKSGENAAGPADVVLVKLPTSRDAFAADQHPTATGEPLQSTTSEAEIISASHEVSHIRALKQDNVAFAGKAEGEARARDGESAQVDATRAGLASQASQTFKTKKNKKVAVASEPVEPSQGSSTSINPPTKDAKFPINLKPKSAHAPIRYHTYNHRYEHALFTPYAFAFTAPSSLDLMDLYNEPGSSTMTKRVQSSGHSALMTIRVSLRPLPGLLIHEVGSRGRKAYRDKMGVVEVSMVVEARKNRHLANNVEPLPEWRNAAKAGAIVSVKHARGHRSAAEPAKSSDYQDNPLRPGAMTSPRLPLEHVADSMSLSASTAPSTSISTPPLPPKTAETTFYSSSPAIGDVQDPAIIELRKHIMPEEKTFIPASTATISSAPAHPVIPLSQSTAAGTSSYPSSNGEMPTPHRYEVSYPTSHHPKQQDMPIPYYHTYVDHSQPVQAADGTYWHFSPYNRPEEYTAYPESRSYTMTPSVPVYAGQPYYHDQAAFASHPYHVNKHVQMREMQPYDSPPYSPHDAISPVHSHWTGQSGSFVLPAPSALSYSQPMYGRPHRSSSSFGSAPYAMRTSQGSGAFSQPHPLSLPPQMPSAAAPSPQAYPADAIPSTAGYTYDPETGLMTDHTGLVFPPQHQPLSVQSYQGPVRSLTDYQYASASDQEVAFVGNSAQQGYAFGY